MNFAFAFKGPHRHPVLLPATTAARSAAHTLVHALVVAALLAAASATVLGFAVSLGRLGLWLSQEELIAGDPTAAESSPLPVNLDQPSPALP
jgi:hypothetical protein